MLFNEGELVERGALLARIDDRSIKAALAQAQAEKSSGEADLRIAELDLSRYNGLRDRSIVSRQTIRPAGCAGRESSKRRFSPAKHASSSTRAAFSSPRFVRRCAGAWAFAGSIRGNLVQVGDEQGLVTVTQVDPISVMFTLPQKCCRGCVPGSQSAVGRCA